VNFTSPLLMAQRAGTAMAAQGSGRIVLVASTLALGPAPLTAAYAASKAALVSAARSLALELGPRGVCVNAVAPGVVDTDMVRSVRPRADGAQHPEPERALTEQLEYLRKLHLLGRLGRPQEVAEAVLYLLCAPYVTGTVLTVDGGLLLGGGAG
jgi:NAD(P)-dependent dehydrogenase (short-subunit alcohol dehydrogenase family)